MLDSKTGFLAFLLAITPKWVLKILITLGFWYASYQISDYLFDLLDAIPVTIDSLSTVTGGNNLIIFLTMGGFVDGFKLISSAFITNIILRIALGKFNVFGLNPG